MADGGIECYRLPLGDLSKNHERDDSSALSEARRTTVPRPELRVWIFSVRIRFMAPARPRFTLC